MRAEVDHSTAADCSRSCFVSLVQVTEAGLAQSGSEIGDTHTQNPKLRTTCVIPVRLLYQDLISGPKTNAFFCSELF